MTTMPSTRGAPSATTATRPAPGSDHEDPALYGIPLRTREEAAAEGYVPITVPIVRGSDANEAILQSMARCLRAPTPTGPAPWEREPTRACAVIKRWAGGQEAVEFWRHGSQIVRGDYDYGYRAYRMREPGSRGQVRGARSAGN